MLPSRVYFAFKSATFNGFLFYRTIMTKGEDGPDQKSAVALAEQTRIYSLWAMEKDVKPMQFLNGSGERVAPAERQPWVVDVIAPFGGRRGHGARSESRTFFPTARSVTCA